MRHRHEGSIIFSANLEFLHRVGTVAHSQVHFPPVQSYFYGSTNSLCQQRSHHRVFARKQLAAKSASHVLLDDAHVTRWNIQAGGYGIAHAKNCLGGIPNGEIIAIPVHHTAVHLGGIVNRHLSRKFFLNDNLRF